MACIRWNVSNIRPNIDDDQPDVGQIAADVAAEEANVANDVENEDIEPAKVSRTGDDIDPRTSPNSMDVDDEDAGYSDQDHSILTQRLEWSEKSKRVARFLMTGNVPLRMTTKSRKSLTAEALKYQVIDRALWRRPEGKFQRRRVIDDLDFRKMIIRECHAKFDHRGREATLNRIRGLYYWRGMSVQVADAIRTCEICQLYDAQRQDEPGLPFSRINLD